MEERAAWIGAISISQLADAGGIRKASLYGHFAKEQEILDAVVELALKGYAQHLIFADANWDIFFSSRLHYIATKSMC